MATFVKLLRYIRPNGKESLWEVSISYNHPRNPGCYGYFEHDVEGEGGGLWFAKNDEGKWELADYDGVFDLPRSVIKTLLAAGFTVDKDF